MRGFRPTRAFGLADPAVLVLLANIGLGLVFLLAGYELDPRPPVSSARSFRWRWL